MWFDSSSIASIAKNALKEGKKPWKLENLLRGDFSSNAFVVFPAQKVVDNVLDIKDDEDGEKIAVEETRMVKSKTLPSMQDIKKEQEDSVWGSFNGSFFDSKPAPVKPITNPPPRKSDTSSGKLNSSEIAMWNNESSRRISRDHQSNAVHSSIAWCARQQQSINAAEFCGRFRRNNQ